MRALALLLVLLPALARAESAVVLVREGGAADELDRARGGLIEALAERGVRLVRAPDGDVCSETDCARAIAETTGADFVAIVALERAEGASQVRVFVVRAAGDPEDAVVVVGDAGPGAAAASALDQALSTSGDPRSGFLMVRTRPPGAVVHIDGERAGESPLRRMVSPGAHRVRIVPREGEPREQSVEVTALEETAIDVDLRTEDGGAPAPTGPTRSEPSPWNWIIGGALAIAGVVVLISPLQTIAMDGECVDLIEGVGCVERVHVGPVTGVLLGVGIAALIAAVVVDVVAPIRMTVAVDPASAWLGVEGSF